MQMSLRPETNKDQRNFAWMPSRKRPMPQVSVLSAVRSGASLSERACAGVRPTVGGPALIQTLSAIRTAVVIHSIQPPEDSTTICTDELGKVGSPHLSASPGLGSHAPPPQ